MVAMKEHLRVVRESSAHQVSVVQLNERVQSMEKELTRGKEHINDLENKLETHKTKLESVRYEMVEAKSKMVLEVSRADEASGSLEAAKEDLLHERRRGEELSEALEQLRSDSSTIKADIASMLLEARAPQAGRDADTNKAKVEVLQAEVERLRAAESASLFNDSSRIALELAALKTANDRLQKAHEEDTKALEEVKSDNASALRVQLAESEAECRELRSKMLHKSSTYKMEMDTISQNKVQALEKKVSELSAEVAKAKSHAVVLEAQVAQATQASTKGDSERTTSMISVDAIQLAVDEAKRSVEAEMTARLAASEEASALELKEVSACFFYITIFLFSLLTFWRLYNFSRRRDEQR